MSSLHFKHIGVAVADFDQAIKVYERLFNFKLLSGPFEDPIQKVRVCFVGEDASSPGVIELVCPLNKDSPVTKILGKGGGTYHICYETDNINEALAQARACGCLVMSPPVSAEAFAGKRIAWVYAPTRQLIEFVER